jgi:TBC1 domain family member 10
MQVYCAGVYRRLVAAEAPAKDAEIVRDLNRTYPSHVYYQQRQGPGQLSLDNVLKAFSLYDTKVHTVQQWTPGRADVSPPFSDVG